ncbi:MAG: hypothetical protein IJY24_07360 [Clostridia bacterium]|nr:hypothetical protein [Clostridia bacterium]
MWLALGWLGFPCGYKACSVGARLWLTPHPPQAVPLPLKGKALVGLAFVGLGLLCGLSHTDRRDAGPYTTAHRPMIIKSNHIWELAHKDDCRRLLFRWFVARQTQCVSTKTSPEGLHR